MDDLKLEILRKIMEDMDAMDGGRIKPKSVSVEVEKGPMVVRDGEMKPLSEHADGMPEEKGEASPDEDGMSDEDAEILQRLLSGKDDEEK